MNQSPDKNQGFLLATQNCDFATPAKHSPLNYKAPERSSIMESKILVSEQDIINTYSEKDKFSCQKYFEYKKLIQENPSFGHKKCAKILGLKIGQTRWWHTKGEKKAIPNPLKVVQKLKEAGFLPFTENHKESKLIFNMLGVIFGDGCVDINLNTFSFISADKRDIDLWENDFKQIFSFAKDKLDIIEGGDQRSCSGTGEEGDIYGSSYAHGWVDNGDETVSDTTSGLMWQKADNGLTVTWQTALAYCNVLSLAGHDDWHLPTLGEIWQMYDYENGSCQSVFASCNHYWSSTSMPTSPDNAYYLYTVYGFIHFDGKSYDTDNKARCVRSGKLVDFNLSFF